MGESKILGEKIYEELNLVCSYAIGKYEINEYDWNILILNLRQYVLHSLLNQTSELLSKLNFKVGE
jgi:hypothetical protein